LDDEFDTAAFLSTRDAGELACVGNACGAAGPDAASAGPNSSTVPNSNGGRGGTTSDLTGGTGNDPSDASLDTPDAGGTAESADTGATSAAPPCWVVQLNDTTHIADNNCLGIRGWNDVETDPSSAQTSVALSYRNGDVCFAGTIAPGGWGAVYSLTFANESNWNAANLGVNGFEFEMTGPLLPNRLEVIYTDSVEGDHCRIITPAPTVTVPFDSAHPGCSTDASRGAPDPTRLTDLRLHWPAAASAYDFDFCLELGAVP
jgi:hypothetical protein